MAVSRFGGMCCVTTNGRLVKKLRTLARCEPRREDAAGAGHGFRSAFLREFTVLQCGRG